MLYTIVGGITGLVVTGIFCKIAGIDCSDGSTGCVRVASPGALLMIGGSIAGAGIGMGIGANALLQGTHLVQKLVRKIF